MAASGAASATLPFGDVLPRDLVVSLIFGRLSVDTRLRCREVCRSWKSFLDEAAELWTHIDLSAESGGVIASRTPALLCAACARAGEHLLSLDVSGWECIDAADILDALVSDQPNRHAPHTPRNWLHRRGSAWPSSEWI